MYTTLPREKSLNVMCFLCKCCFDHVKVTVCTTEHTFKSVSEVFALFLTLPGLTSTLDVCGKDVYFCLNRIIQCFLLQCLKCRCSREGQIIVNVSE